MSSPLENLENCTFNVTLTCVNLAYCGCEPNFCADVNYGRMQLVIT